MLESGSQSKILNHLHSKLKAWTVKVISANKKGVPDIIACVPMTKEQVLKLFETRDTIGVFVAPEIKRPDGKGVTSPHQKRNIKQIKHAGGIASSDITCVEDLERLLNE